MTTTTAKQRHAHARASRPPFIGPPIPPGILARRNIGLAVSIMGRHLTRYPYLSRLDSDDRFGATMEGLMIACHRYDPDKGCLGTIADWYILSRLQYYARHVGVVSTPSHLNHYAQDDERLDPETVTKAHRTMLPAVPLEEPVFSTGNGTEGPTVLDFESERVWVQGMREKDAEPIEVDWVRRAMRSLRPRQLQAVRLRHWQGMILEDAGVVMGVSKERVRQILGHAMARLRAAMTRIESQERRRMRG